MGIIASEARRSGEQDAVPPLLHLLPDHLLPPLPLAFLPNLPLALLPDPSKTRSCLLIHLFSPSVQFSSHVASQFPPT